MVTRVSEGVEALNRRYWSPTLAIWLDRAGDDVRGHYDGRVNPPWWSAANAVETLIDFMDATGTAKYQPMIEALYEVQRHKKNKRPRIVEELKRRGQWNDADTQKLRQREADEEKRANERAPGEAPSRKAAYYIEFRNEYLDDSAWWAVAWLRMHDRTKQSKYLDTARAIHAHMAKNWDPQHGGGIMWCEDEDKRHPNSITNSLFIIISARIYERTREESFLKWADQGLEWFRAQGLYDGTAVVDMPGHKGDYWTYNQGTYLGALVAMHKATGKAEYLEFAEKAAETILSRSGVVLPSGVVVEKLGTNGWDPGMFKGVFARYLGQLRDTLVKEGRNKKLSDEIHRVLTTSASSLITSGVDANGEYSISWHPEGTDHTRNFNTQLSALALFTATLGSK